MCLLASSAVCAVQIAHFKIPRYILFVTSYPLTAIGKVGLHNHMHAQTHGCLLTTKVPKY